MGNRPGDSINDSYNRLLWHGESCQHFLGQVSTCGREQALRWGRSKMLFHFEKYFQHVCTFHWKEMVWIKLLAFSVIWRAKRHRKVAWQRENLPVIWSISHSDVNNSLEWATWKPGAQSLSGSFSWMVGTQLLERSPVASQGAHQQETRVEKQSQHSNLGIPIRWPK